LEKNGASVNFMDMNLHSKFDDVQTKDGAITERGLDILIKNTVFVLNSQ